MDYSKGIELVGWDYDGVGHLGYTNTILAQNNPRDCWPYVESFVRKEWFTYGEIEKWEKYNKRQLESIGDLADLLTDFYNDWGRSPDGEILSPDREEEKIQPAISKNQKVEGEHGILEGLTLGKSER